MQNKLVGQTGTPNRYKFEYELQMNLIGKAIKQTRQERNLTQEEFGKLIGVQKAQIFKTGKQRQQCNYRHFNESTWSIKSKIASRIATC